ncbi:hypothetical protein SK128_022536 [Halocaridina rubra]|uniref:Uncharacterized protein n=1 Tax=Halocaridina rubra TaxID=373956 RepID=A0AAN8X565_HALRR
MITKSRRYHYTTEAKTPDPTLKTAFRRNLRSILGDPEDFLADRCIPVPVGSASYVRVSSPMDQLRTPGRIDPLDCTRAYTFSYARVLSRRSILPVTRSLLRLIWSSESRRLLGAAANYRMPSTTVQDPLDFFKLRRTVRIPSYADEKLHPIIVSRSG